MWKPNKKLVQSEILEVKNALASGIMVKTIKFKQSAHNLQFTRMLTEMQQVNLHCDGDNTKSPTSKPAKFSLCHYWESLFQNLKLKKTELLLSLLVKESM